MKQYQLLVQSFRDSAVREPGYVFSIADDAPEPEEGYAVPYVAPKPVEAKKEVTDEPKVPVGADRSPEPFPAPPPAPEPAPSTETREPASMAESKLGPV